MMNNNHLETEESVAFRRLQSTDGKAYDVYMYTQVVFFLNVILIYLYYRTTHG